ncbi:MAG: TRAP transporter substrate-binding protein [Chitinophagaceae bacterium]|nr:TRAP transporter substrate-binding protein [Rubrivivax sp.]
MSFITRSLFAAAAVCAATGAQAQTKWDLPAAYPAGNFHTITLTEFAADVDKATAGKLKITVHAGASLFKANEIKRAVQGGQAQIGEVLLANLANEWPIYAVDGLPFLADSYEAAMKLYRAQKPLMEKKLGEQGLMLLYSVPWPPQGLFSKRPVNMATDLKGIKWRAYSPATARIGELVGAQPVTVQAAEVAQALATGVIESFMTSGSTAVDSKTYEHLKYFYDTQAWLPKNAVIVNQAAFDALDAPTKAAVLKAGADAEVRGLAASQRTNTESKERLKAGGMQILPPPATLTGDMKKVGDVMLKEWLDRAGPEGKQLIDGFNAK